jgi:lipoprotein-releasing system ATP-binding protein
VLGVVVCLNIDRIREFIGWLTDTELFAPELYFLSQLPADGYRGDRFGGAHGADALAARHALSVLARGPPRSRRSAALRVSGQVLINGVDCVALSDSEQTRMRRMEVGFVYQFHHLLPEFSALENVVLPQLILGSSRAEAEARAKDLLKSLGLEERWDHRPTQLSGGEQQRVAIARAVANDPKVLLADEPTGNLDPPTAERVFEQLISLIRNSGVAAVIATHNLDLAARMDRTLRLVDGLLVEEEVAVVEVSG